MSFIKIYRLLFLTFLLLSCANDEPSESEINSEDCSGVPGGNLICGCMDSAAYNYDPMATSDDGSCQMSIDNGDYFLTLNGSGNSYVDLGDMMSNGSYTKAAWVYRNYGYVAGNNIISGNAGHAFLAPQNGGAKLSAGHNGDWTIVQDADSLPEHVWTFVAVTYDSSNRRMTLFKNGIQIDQAENVEPPEESTSTYIGRFNNGNTWYGSIDEAAIWNTALSMDEIVEISSSSSNLNANVNRGAYSSSNFLLGYWRMNEGEGSILSDASGNGNMGTMNQSSWETCENCGCTDTAACNYDESATIDNRTCRYIENACDSCVDGELIVYDNDLDGICDDVDEDDDNDNVLDENDISPLDRTSCSDVDSDGCDDCSSGIFDISNDGPDDDGDGICNSQIITGRSVYIVGDSYNSDGDYTACYWKDGVRVELPGGAWATDIVVVDGVVYTCGTGSGGDACYWIDQTKYDLPGSFGEAEAIAVHNGDIYVAGWFDSGSCYWVNGQKVNLTTNGDSQAFAIAVRDNGMVYVGGYYLNNHHYVIPCFWKDGNNRTNLPVPSGGDGEVYDIALEDGNMRYYAGVALHTSNFAGYTPKACYWRHTTRTDLRLGGSTMDIYGAKAYGITIDGGDIYTAGETDWYGQYGVEPSGGSYPQYWKNNTIYDLEGGPLNSWGTGTAYDIRVADGNVVVVGVATVESPDPSTPEGSFKGACYWINGELHYLVNNFEVPQSIEEWMHSYARGVHIE